MDNTKYFNCLKKLLSESIEFSDTFIKRVSNDFDIFLKQLLELGFGFVEIKSSRKHGGNLFKIQIFVIC